MSVELLEELDAGERVISENRCVCMISPRHGAGVERPLVTIQPNFVTVHWSYIFMSGRFIMFDATLHKVSFILIQMFNNQVTTCQLPVIRVLKGTIPPKI